MGLRGMPEAELAFTRTSKLAAEAPVACPAFAVSAAGFADLMNAYNSAAGRCRRPWPWESPPGAFGIGPRLSQGRRHQFGRPLAEFQGLQWMLADMDTARPRLAQALIWKRQRAAGNGSGFPDMGPLAAQAKIFAAEIGRSR